MFWKSIWKASTAQRLLKLYLVKTLTKVDNLAFRNISSSDGLDAKKDIYGSEEIVRDYFQCNFKRFTSELIDIQKLNKDEITCNEHIPKSFNTKFWTHILWRVYYWKLHINEYQKHALCISWKVPFTDVLQQSQKFWRMEILQTDFEKKWQYIIWIALYFEASGFGAKILSHHESRCGIYM